MVRALKERQDVLSNLIGFSWLRRANVEVGNELKQVDLLKVTGDFYAELGTQPAVGRLIGPQDMNLASFASEPVAVLGWGFWQREYGGDAAAIGRTIRVEGQPFTVIGIAPRGFTALSLIQEPSVTVPLSGDDDPQVATSPHMLWVHLAGHLVPAIRLEQARARLAPVWTSIKTDLVPADFAPQRRANFLSLGLNLWSAQTGIADGRARFTQPLGFMLALAVIVLAIACLNVAGLMLARAAGQTHEIGIRLALGASSWDIRRQAIVEALVLGSLAGGLGLLVAQGAVPTIAGFMLQEWEGSVVLQLTPDLPELGVVATIVLCVCVLFGALPVWRMHRRSATDVFQGGARVSVRIGHVGPMLAYGPVSPGFVEFFGLTLREGRAFTWGDDSGRPRIAIVSQSLANRLYPGRSAVGQYINFGPTPAGQHIQIVGVIKDIKFYDVKNGSPLLLLVPTLQNPEGSQPAVLLRGAVPAAALRQAVNSLGRSYVLRIRSLDDIARTATRQKRLAAIAGSLFGGIAVGLAALGLYGLLMYIVSRRAREFAIRVALGGHTWKLINLVLRQGAGIVATGAVFGSLVAVVSIRWLDSLLYDIKAFDALALALAIVPLGLAAVSIVASAIPAARASHADPLTLMRAE